MTTITIDAVVLSGIIFNAAMVGSAWGNLRNAQRRMEKDIVSIKKALGKENGDNPEFVRRTECSLVEHGVGRRLDELHQKILAIGLRLDRQGDM